MDKKGVTISGQETYRTSFCIGDYKNAFTLIIQRKAIQRKTIKGQASLDLDSQEGSGEISLGS